MLFGRRRQQRDEPEEQSGELDETAAEREPTEDGPYDGDFAPEDGRTRLDLGSVLLPVPEGAQLQVEVDRSGPVRAVHLMTELGQLTVSAFAAPRSGGLWGEVADELVDQLQGDGAQVSEFEGEWGREISARTSRGVLRFLGVDGPRWMLRGVAAASDQQVEPLVGQLRDVVRHTVVVRGTGPLPVRSPLPLQLPEPLAQQLEQTQDD